MRKLRVLDLFSGIGGFSLGLERTGGFETVAFCEIEEFPRKVLAKHWPGVPCYEDVRKLKGKDIGAVDVICGGYPCQPFSTAGRRKGAEDDRHLWPEFSRLVDELQPAWVIGENVAGHVSMGLDDVLSDLEGKGYTARTFIIPACAVNAPHRRDRIWVIANSTSKRQPRSRQHGERFCAKENENWKAGKPLNAMEGPTEPPFCGTDHGVSDGLDRLRALGNAVVPQIPEMLGYAILEAMRESEAA